MSIFITNKYTKWYNSIISAAIARGFTSRAKAKKVLGYVEQHHVLPKSLGGADTKENLVFLTAKEHFTCHHLLTKMVEGAAYYKMSKALARMLIVAPGHQRHRATAKLFEKIRIDSGKAHSAIISGRPSGRRGIPHSEDAKRKQSLSMKGKNLGVPKSIETRERMSAATLGVRKSEAHKNGIKKGWVTSRDKRTGTNHPMYGRTHSAETREKMKQKSAVSKFFFSCPHCGKEGEGKGNYVRWHGENCKLLKVNTTQRSNENSTHKPIQK